MVRGITSILNLCHTMFSCSPQLAHIKSCLQHMLTEFLYEKDTSGVYYLDVFPSVTISVIATASYVETIFYDSFSLIFT